MEITREKLATAATVAIYPIRFVQLGSIAIAGYAACYLVSMHHHHYCVWYRCSVTQMEHISVPIGEVLFITAVRNWFPSSVHPLQLSRNLLDLSHGLSGGRSTSLPDTYFLQLSSFYHVEYNTDQEN